MNDEDVTAVRRIVRDEVYEILDIEVFDPILQLVNGMEVKIAAFKDQLKGKKETWDPSMIRWDQAEGSSGHYEKSSDIANPQFEALLRDLQKHGGKLSRDAFFYWAFEDGKTVGRKKRT
jgi:hypothetical protein